MLAVLAVVVASGSYVPRVFAQEAELSRLDANRFYGEIQFAAGTVAHSDLRFHPLFASFSAGAYLLPGIGLEGFVDTEVNTDEQGVFELGVTQAAGLALRLESPPQRGLQAYILLGYVDFTLEQSEEDNRGARTVVQSYTGARVSVGLMQRLKSVPNLLVGAEYRLYHVEDEIQVDGWGLGIRVNVK